MEIITFHVTKYYYEFLDDIKYVSCTERLKMLSSKFISITSATDIRHRRRNKPSINL